MASNNSRSNRTLIPEARHGLDQFKYEVASEMGMQNYDHVDKGNLSSRQNGSVGGEMVRRMVQSYEQNLK
ncbi:Small, acid-soluble spore protein, alpha/beta type [Clostridium cavendishii DSM 21758]|uniref:Small, acid-soluble spore protein, alpha/beta type n=1 Tax=Clostridium cavendishii DSM 21758 TaxID=1121302 RepID=A0A1M6EUV9_9CLOT|nr:alpha/beta-type small acid-soluble spore protein [Clostridium cavendishii]SHI89169.1 Small, acid-soluble spore protein, alpha/beta type [Clostridium cavendishii DSM 21758]